MTSLYTLTVVGVVFNYYKRSEEEGEEKREEHAATSTNPRRVSSSASASVLGSLTTPDTKLVQLQWVLDVQRGHAAQDVSFVRQQGQEFDAKSTSAGAAIFLDTSFQRWMSADVPDLVYVEARLERIYGKTSPISYFCAQLVHKFNEAPHTTVTLSFFCGQHVAVKDALRGPRGLMRSLIAQLLRAWPKACLDDLDLAALEGRNHTCIPVAELCLMFKLVVRQIPCHYNVICIVDDVGRLEMDEWSSEYWAVMGMLEDLVNGAEAGVRFKVLITSPARSRWLRGDKEVQPHHRVLVTDSGLPMGLRI
ncbi:hypothetical protein B0T26DRAFT_137105 [Lasiosphaeria miniovina]|uniref:Nephrocystin 3-like N-terminal domain-containing protein n=1 Tax=Lasiosphaeria miniovina TaxID=1954250 RepID=A0AA40B4B2_9PEZI|nr:uncharacterized protein B0T26DRAFT_137105 [Lasiosphaeria miniovina]KAK0727451.1 hypothetical protein B0T26DRAFT_137105 [Lasiosphaeria miniovina]